MYVKIKKEVENLEYSFKKIDDLIKSPKNSLGDVSNIKQEIDGGREKLKEKIDVICNEMIQKLNDYQKICIENILCQSFHRRKPSYYGYMSSQHVFTTQTHSEFFSEPQDYKCPINKNTFYSSSLDKNSEVVVKKELICSPKLAFLLPSEQIDSTIDVKYTPIKSEIVKENCLNTQTSPPTLSPTPSTSSHYAYDQDDNLETK